MSKGKLFILLGQSGVGKNTILDAILKKHPDFWRVVTYTTREPRPEEIPGEDHYFVYKEKFDSMVKNGELLEHAFCHDDWYGTPKKEVIDVLKNGKNAIAEIEYQGAMQIKETMPEAITIFIKYEDGDLRGLIERRLKNDPGRGDVSEEEIETRYHTALKEKRFIDKFDYQVINPEGHPEVAIGEVENIIKKELAN